MGHQRGFPQGSHFCGGQRAFAFPGKKRTGQDGVAIFASANVWRHLAKLDSRFKVDFDQLQNCVRICANFHG